MRDGSRFVVLEGGDGVGKSTQIALLSGWLGAVGLPHLTTREPGGTPVGEAIREIVLGRSDLDIGPETELFLILAARAAFVRDVVRPALAEGKTVVADRFSLSTLAYQGYGRELDLDHVREADDLARGGLRPDLCLVLDLPAEESRERQRRGVDEADRIEREGRDFRERVRRGYLELADTEPDVELVNARGTPEEVHERIRDRLLARFPGVFRGGGATDAQQVG